MRETKYRAFDGNKMIYDGDRVKPSHLMDIPLEYFSTAKVYHNKVELWFKETMMYPNDDSYFDHPTFIAIKDVMQSTFLRDKNNKEIWRGDIIRVDEMIPHDIGTELIQSFPKAVVCWELSFAAFTYNPISKFGGYNNAHQLLWLGCNKEVIGNIYETPELLSNERN